MNDKRFDLSRPVHLSEDGRHFLDGQDTPFYWLGDTAWPLLTLYSQADAEEFLADRARKGFTVILAVMAYGGATSKEQQTPLPNPEGERPWHESPGQPNEAFFRYIDHLIDFAGRCGLTLAVLPVWGYYVTDAGTFTKKSAAAYGRWLGQRYRETPNLIWVNGGDRSPEHHHNIFAALAAGLRDGDRGAHLITYHPHAWRSTTQYFFGERSLDFEMIQTWREWAMVHPAVLADVIRHPRRPVVLAEPAYEAGDEYGIGSWITSHQMRCQAWWTVMAGGFFTYGHSQMWRMEPGWLAAKDAPGAQDMAILREIVTALPWWRLFPDQSLLYSGVSSGRTLNAALRAGDGSCALIYLSSPCGILISLHRLSGRRVEAWYISPHTGERRAAGTFATGNLDKNAPYPPVTQPQPFATPDGWEDAVILLQNVDASH